MLKGKDSDVRLSFRDDGMNGASWPEEGGILRKGWFDRLWQNMFARVLIIVVYFGVIGTVVTVIMYDMLYIPEIPKTYTEEEMYINGNDEARPRTARTVWFAKS